MQLDGGHDVPDHRLKRGCHRKHRRLQQHERCNAVGMIGRELHGDIAAVRMADHVRAKDAELIEEGEGIGGLIGNAEGRAGARASGETAAVIADQLISR